MADQEPTVIRPDFQLHPEAEQEEGRAVLVKVAARTVISDDGCWLWMGGVSSGGYGEVRYHGVTVNVHRLVYALCVTSIPAGLCVCHRCDVRRCCRLDHLFLGTKAENNADMGRKGRARNDRKHGEQHGHAKLTEDLVIRGRILAKQIGKSAAARLLAQETGHPFDRLRPAISGQSWRHLPL